MTIGILYTYNSTLTAWTVTSSGGALVTANALAVSGNITGGSILSSGLISTTGNINGAYVNGNISTANILTGGLISAAGNISGSYIIGNGSYLTGVVTNYGNANVANYLPVYGSNILVTNINNASGNGSGNIGNSSSYFNVVFAKSTSAQYADLAEVYMADNEYDKGTVVVFGGPNEITVSNISHDTRVAGVVSTNPAYVMNSSNPGIAIALTGKVPCWVKGPVCKGDRLVNIESGTAGRIDPELANIGCIIGKSLCDINDTDIHLIEIAVGRY